MMIRPWAVVLGASTGVGAAIAQALVWQQYNVLGFHRGNHQAEADDLNHKLTPHGILVGTDVGASVMAVEDGITRVASLIQKPRAIKVLVHSLSGASIGNILTKSPRGIECTFNNLAHSLVWWVQQLVHTDMLAPDARIIALSNPCPDFYLRDTGVIGAAKAALEAYVKTLAVELGPRGHRVNAIRFSTVRTPALEAVMPEAMERLDKLHQAIVPAGRMQTARDVAQIVTLLVSEAAGWINGAILDCTGGPTLTLMDYAFYGNKQ
jgi:3-oxoacyl-[acyl-carrier protein] reductase